MPVALDVFDRPQTEQDVPTLPTPFGYGDDDSFRIILAPTSDADNDGYVVYAATSKKGICIVATTPDLGTADASCVSAEAFADQGLELSWTIGRDRELNHLVRWEPDGTVYSERTEDGAVALHR
ncbi:hypothetical protein [Salinibacterium sp. ZJ450]|uniref:hypothetical protein n=1 Tax=Salinibacterium sp. ZJ450 TaxID=2708338 RepID=UPI001420172E|nr:hypothetical protein [Salinibacterium sp. ZJ450]